MRSAPRLSGRTFSARGPPCPSPGHRLAHSHVSERDGHAGTRLERLDPHTPPGPASARTTRAPPRPARTAPPPARVQARSRGCGQGSSSAQARTPTGARTHARAGPPRGVFPASTRARGSAALPAGLLARALGSRRSLQRTAAWASCSYADCGSRFVTQVQHVPRWSEASKVKAATSCPLVRNLLVPARSAFSLLFRGLEL